MSGLAGVPAAWALRSRPVIASRGDRAARRGVRPAQGRARRGWRWQRRVVGGQGHGSGRHVREGYRAPGAGGHRAARIRGPASVPTGGCSRWNRAGVPAGGNRPTWNVRSSDERIAPVGTAGDPRAGDPTPRGGRASRVPSARQARLEARRRLRTSSSPSRASASTAARTAPGRAPRSPRRTGPADRVARPVDDPAAEPAVRRLERGLRARVRFARRSRPPPVARPPRSGTRRSPGSRRSRVVVAGTARCPTSISACVQSPARSARHGRVGQGLHRRAPTSRVGAAGHDPPEDPLDVRRRPPRPARRTRSRPPPARCTGPTPGSASSASTVSGTRPPCSATIDLRGPVEVHGPPVVAEPGPRPQDVRDGRRRQRLDRREAGHPRRPRLGRPRRPASAAPSARDTRTAYGSRGRPERELARPSRRTRRGRVAQRGRDRRRAGGGARAAWAATSATIRARRWMASAVRRGVLGPADRVAGAARGRRPRGGRAGSTDLWIDDHLLSDEGDWRDAQARGLDDARGRRRRHHPGAARAAGRRQHVPQPGAHREARDDPRPRQRRARDPRPRRRLVRARARRVRASTSARASASGWTGSGRRSR